MNNKSDGRSSSKYSVCEEEHHGKTINDYSHIKESGIGSIKVGLYDYQ